MTKVKKMNITNITTNWINRPEVQEGFKIGYQHGLIYFGMDIYIMFCLMISYLLLKMLFWRRPNKNVQILIDLTLFSLFFLIIYTFAKMLVLRPA